MCLFFINVTLTPVFIGVDKTEWITYLSIILFLDSIWNLPLLILRAENKAISYIFISLLNVVLTMSFNIFIIKMNYGVEGVFLSNIISSSLILLVSIKIMFDNIKIQSFDTNILKKY